MKLAGPRKIGLGLYLGFLAGLVAGFGKTAFFLISEGFFLDEARGFALNFAQVNTVQLLPIGILLGLLLGLAWLIFDRLDGLLVSGCVTLIPFLPIVYFVNKNFLPGFREPTSLISNGGLVLLALGITFLLFFRWFKGMSNS